MRTTKILYAEPNSVLQTAQHLTPHMPMPAMDKGLIVVLIIGFFYFVLRNAL